MQIVTTSDGKAKQRPSTCPAQAEERFWQRYSPHYELPLACATSLFTYGVVLAVLAVGGLAFLIRGSAEEQKPAQMDVLLIEGSEGLGLGGPPGLPGLPGDPGKSELAEGPAGPEGSTPGAEAGAEELPELPQVPGMELEAPSTDNPSDSADDLLKQLGKLGQDAEKRSQSPPKLSGPTRSGSGTKTAGGGAGPKGSGGQGGGKGMPGGGGGRKATDQEIKAWRWRFDLTGGPKEHADKLDRAGLIVAVPDITAGKPDPRKGPYLFIKDLKRRPVTIEKGDLAKYEDAVKWYNQRPESVRALGDELKLEQIPPYIVLLLPRDREAKMAAEELRFAKHNRMDISKVQETWFDFRLKNGAYEAVAIRQR